MSLTDPMSDLAIQLASSKNALDSELEKYPWE